MGMYKFVMSGILNKGGNVTFDSAWLTLRNNQFQMS